MYKHNWVVYAKQPFSGAQSVVEYMARYTHKIAISNHRIKDHQSDKVTFSYKDYKQGSIKKEMTLDILEFIRRFSLHILPKKFVRIRHYGICSSSSKEKSALVIKAQLPAMMPKLISLMTKAAPLFYNPKQCPRCKKETMKALMHFNMRGPPDEWKEKAANLLTASKTVNASVV